jgi:putative sterol carrier protein
VTEAVNIKPLFETMPTALNREAAKDADVVYQFNISGEGGGQFTVAIKQGTCTVAEGISPAPAVTIAASATDYLSIATGAYPFGLAFINGRLKVQGDLRLVMRMGAYFAPPPA